MLYETALSMMRSKKWSWLNGAHPLGPHWTWITSELSATCFAAWNELSPVLNGNAGALPANSNSAAKTSPPMIGIFFARMKPSQFDAIICSINFQLYLLHLCAADAVGVLAMAPAAKTGYED